MKFKKSELRKMVLEELEQMGDDTDWETRSLSIVTMLANINSSLAGTNTLLEEQNRLLNQVIRNTSTVASRLEE